MKGNYVLSESFKRANIQDRLWYAQTEEDKQFMLEDTNTNLAFCDKVYVITTKKLYILGADNKWYDM